MHTTIAKAALRGKAPRSRGQVRPALPFAVPTPERLSEQTLRFVSKDEPREFSVEVIPESIRNTFAAILGVNRLHPETGKPIYDPVSREQLNSASSSYPLKLDQIRLHVARLAEFLWAAVRVNMVARPFPGDKFRYDFGDLDYPADKLIAKYWLCDGDEHSPVYERLCERLLGPTIDDVPDVQTGFFELRRLNEHIALQLARCLYIGTEESLFGWFTPLSATTGRYTYFTRLVYPDNPSRWQPGPDIDYYPVRALHTHDVVEMNVHKWPAHDVHYPLWIYDLLQRANNLCLPIRVVDGDLSRQTVIVRTPERRENFEEYLDIPAYEPCFMLGDVVLCGWAEEDLEPSPDGLPIRHDPGYEMLFENRKPSRWQKPGRKKKRRKPQAKSQTNSRPSVDARSRFAGGRFTDFSRR